MRAVLAITLAIAMFATAFADEADDRKSAERHFRAGEKAYAAQNFAAAATNFEEAYKLLALPEIAFSVAQAYRRQYRVDPKLEYAKKAAEHYRYYLDKVKTGGKVGVAADAVGEMEHEVGKLTAAGAKAAAAVVVEHTRLGVSPILGEKRNDAMREIVDLPDDTRVKITASIDGKPVPPYQMIDVEPGPHLVRIEVEGFIISTTTERVVKGESKNAEIPLKPKPASISVKTERGAKVRVDGRPVGMAFEIPAGKHLITILRSGRETVSREIDVGRGQQLALEQPLHKTPRRRAVPFVFAGAIGLGVITLGGLIYSGSVNNQVDEQLALIRAGDQRPEALDKYNDLTARRGEVVTGVLITGGLALVVAGAAGALYWLDRPEEGVRVAPVASASGGGITLGGRF
jgi:hypothetical protein